MSPQDKVERVLKDIHITFSKCETYNGHPDKIIVDRKKFLHLLDRLNQGIFDMMEQYEQTRQSRESAERAFRRKGDEIIEAANGNAEDIYAASVIYTADMLGRIRDLMDQTNESMNDLFRQFRKDLREQKDLVKTHETELQGQLADMADTKKYLSIIKDINRERDRKNRDLQAEKEAGAQYARNMVYTPASDPEVKVNELYFEKAGKPVPKDSPIAETAAEKPDIKINKDAAYFKWKESQEKQSVREDVKPEPVDGHADTNADGPEQTEGTENIAENITENITEHPNPDFPDEEAIRRAVLEDELAMEMEEHEQKRENQGAGKILKNIIFGKD